MCVETVMYLPKVHTGRGQRGYHGGVYRARDHQVRGLLSCPLSHMLVHLTQTRRELKTESGAFSCCGQSLGSWGSPNGSH